MGEGAADGTGEGEARVEGNTRELLRLGGLDVLLDSVKLDAASGGGRGLSRHCEGCAGWSGDSGVVVVRWWWRWRSMVQKRRHNFYEPPSPPYRTG